MRYPHVRSVIYRRDFWIHCLYIGNLLSSSGVSNRALVYSVQGLAVKLLSLCHKVLSFIGKEIDPDLILFYNLLVNTPRGRNF